MKNSVPDRSLIIESDEDDVNEEEGRRRARAKDPDVVTDPSDSSDDDDDDDGDGSPRRSHPNSYSSVWPQSYRQSMDMYTGFTPSPISRLGTPSLGRLGSSFFNSSFGGKHTPEIFTSLLKPLLPTKVDHELQQQQEEQDKIKDEALPPHADTVPISRPSLQKVSEEQVAPKQEAPKISHEVPLPRESSYAQAVLNGINVLCGVGILSTPYAVKEGGWIGLCILFLFAILAWYTGVLLRYCLDSKPGLETYPDIGQAAFGTTGRIVFSIILYLELYSCCVEYIILESDNLSSLFPNAHLSTGGLNLNSHLLFAILTTLIVMPTTWLRDLSLLSYISAGGVIASVLVIVCLFWVGIVDKVGFHNKGTSLNLTRMPIAVGLYGYCFSGHAVFPNIYSSLKKRSQYPSVLFTSFFICTVLFSGASVVGYLMFGESTMSQFTLNLPKHLVASKIAVWTTVVNPITKYALTLMPLAMSLEELIPTNRQKSHGYAIVIRTALVISILLVALSVPFFGLVMALVGSLLTMLVTMILPCACFLKILKGKVTCGQVSLCILIIAVGVVSACFGTYSALSDIIKSLNSH